MTEYSIAFMPQAADDLRRLDKPVAQRILHKLKWLAQNTNDLTPETLAGELRGLYRLRVGSYGVIYTANHEEQLLMVHLIGHRRDIYRRQDSFLAVCRTPADIIVVGPAFVMASQISSPLTDIPSPPCASPVP